MTEIYRLKALDVFKCTGANCPTSCCTEVWADVDTATQEKWNSLENSSTRQWLLENLAEYPGRQGIYLKKDSHQCCQFLDIDKLCGVQKKLGEGYLPLTCRSFPRAQFSKSGKVCQTALMSCPEIVRLIFSESAKYGEYYRVPPQVDSGNPHTSGDRIYELLDDIAVQIIATKKIPAGLRLFYFASVFYEIINVYEMGKLQIQILENVNKSIKNNLYEINLEFKRGKLKPHPVTAGSYWKAIYDLLKSRMISDIYLESNNADLSVAIENCDGSSEGYEKIYAKVTEYRDRARQGIKGVLADQIQLYQENYFRSLGFPLSPSAGLNLFSLVHCLVGLCMFQLLLWMKIAAGQNIENEYLQSLIVELHRKYVQNDTVIIQLKNDGHMKQIDRYCLSFVDIF